MPKLKKHILYNSENLKIFIVDGEYIRDNMYLDFVMGGHDYVYDFIPKNEIWIDNACPIHELFFVLTHELVERFHMKYEKMEYDVAHQIANEIEQILREENNISKTLQVILGYIKKFNDL